MPETYDLELAGCTPEPLMAYLKALGILRLVAQDREHGDPAAYGFWKDEVVFVLRSRLDKQSLEEFFLVHYRPTPIVVPWSGGDFFAVNWEAKASTHKKTPTASSIIESFLGTESARLEPYRTVLTACKMALEQVRIETSVSDNSKVLKKRQDDLKKLKWRFIETLRSICEQSDTLEWIDAAAVTGTEYFAPLLGSGGGSDGNTHFSDNFMQNLWDVLPDFDVQRDAKASRNDTACRAGLRNSIFGEASTFRVEKRTSSLFDSGAVGGPNATQGLERESMSNPWDVILGLEGTLCFAAAAVKRLASNAATAAAFPFQFSASPTIRDGLAEKESSGREVWLPLWHRPAMIGEIRSLLTEGRAEAGVRPARNGVDMARSIAALGVDRGVGSFHRYAIVKGRVGGDNYNTAASLGRFAVIERRDVDLLREIDPWLDSFRRAVKTSAKTEDKAPIRFSSALRAIDSAILEFCRYGGNPFFQKILIALGRAERELALTPGKLGQSKFPPNPLVGLSKDWAIAANDSTDEFQVAQALAGVHTPNHKIGSLRSNIEPVSISRRNDGTLYAKWAEKDRSVVWNAADLSTNLAAVLDRRVMDGARKGCEDLPLESNVTASPGAIAAFLAGDLNDKNIEDLLWGLMLVENNNSGSRQESRQSQPRGTSLPSVYCLLKLLFLPRALIAERREENRVIWRLARPGEKGTHRIRPEPAILALLKAGRAGDAMKIAMRRLRASGLTPLPHRRSGGVSRDHEWTEVRFSPREGHRLVAALLIPIHSSAVNSLVHRATRGEDFEEQIVRARGSP